LKDFRVWFLQLRLEKWDRQKQDLLPRRRTMAKETKVVKGGFRATLALIVSVVALIVSVAAYTSSLREEELSARIRDMQTNLERMKEESSKQIERLRDETGNALERLGDAVKKKQETE
jgi:hypothetical protein